MIHSKNLLILIKDALLVLLSNKFVLSHTLIWMKNIDNISLDNTHHIKGGLVDMDSFMGYLRAHGLCMLYQMYIFFKKFISNNFHRFIHGLFRRFCKEIIIKKFIYSKQLDQNGVVNDMLLIQHFRVLNLNLCHL